ncbi:hypothetical protein LTR36_008907 [Oleoguttula mirabilis]|uniref:Uncharacterized protein n=1 Tax=Oleoguttula mirabilis TaxID=1507867 RepID=A0AAV9J779_9PEZI|nr:hypothetical protein LTR36_008907 [Oleoguttula mirabilis]
MASACGQVQRRCRQRDAEVGVGDRDKKSSQSVTKKNSVSGDATANADAPVEAQGFPWSWLRFFRHTRAQPPVRSARTRFDPLDMHAALRRARRHVSTDLTLEDRTTRRRSPLSEIGFGNYQDARASSRIGRQCAHLNMGLAAGHLAGGRQASFGVPSKLASTAEDAEDGLAGGGPVDDDVLAPTSSLSAGSVAGSQEWQYSSHERAARMRAGEGKEKSKEPVGLGTPSIAPLEVVAPSPGIIATGPDSSDSAKSSSRESWSSDAFTDPSRNDSSVDTAVTECSGRCRWRSGPADGE